MFIENVRKVTIFQMSAHGHSIHMGLREMPLPIHSNVKFNSLNHWNISYLISGGQNQPTHTNEKNELWVKP